MRLSNGFPIPACRRERESAAALKAAAGRRRELEEQLSALGSGLLTLRRLLERQPGASPRGSAAGGSARSPGRRSREGGAGSGASSAAMAALSALLAGLQDQQAVTRRATVVSPQTSEGPGLGAAPDGALGAAGALPSPMAPFAAAAEKPSEPLEQPDDSFEADGEGLMDISMLLPDGADAAEGDSPNSAGAWGTSGSAGPAHLAGARQANGGSGGGAGETIAAVWRHGASASRRLSASRIPPPPAAAAKALTRSPHVGSSTTSPSKRSPGKGHCSKGSPSKGGPSPLKRLFASVCRSATPKATVSGGTEAAPSRIPAPAQ